MLKGVIFDFDGTLFYTNQLIKDAMRYSIKKVLDREIAEKDFINIWGKPLDEQMSYFCRDNLAELIYNYQKYYDGHHEKVRSFPEAVDTLKGLHELGYKVAILSNKRKKGLLLSLNSYNLTEMIDFYLCKEDLTKHKPEPDGFYLIMQKFKLNPLEILMVGDSPADIIGGKRAGVKTALVSYTDFDLKKMLGLKPDYLITHLAEILNLVKAAV